MYVSGLYSFVKEPHMNAGPEIRNAFETHSTLTCPECGYEVTECMPTNACQYYYECGNCGVLLKPRRGDCCVFCSYGSARCPSVQLGELCNQAES